MSLTSELSFYPFLFLDKDCSGHVFILTFTEDQSSLHMSAEYILFKKRRIKELESRPSLMNFVVAIKPPRQFSIYENQQNQKNHAEGHIDSSIIG